VYYTKRGRNGYLQSIDSKENTTFTITITITYFSSKLITILFETLTFLLATFTILLILVLILIKPK